MPELECDKISRRDFLENLVKISALGILAGCASGGLPLVIGKEEDEEIRLRLPETPALNLPNGAISLATPGQGELNIVVLKTAGNEFIALSSICMHLGCRVRKARDGFDCPCHGSRYDLNGKVINGPAAKSLKSFPVRREGEELVIDLKVP
jgi:Rieske Fe-S protein